MKHWITAFRLRTLPLALSSIFMGNFLAKAYGSFRWEICAFTVLTTVFLQILSNLANDYGDAVHGADSSERQGPDRAVHTGVISKTAMKNAIRVFVVLSLFSGLALLWLVFIEHLVLALLFLVLGLAAIYAAITYTAGSKPYGYMGLGDISVFLFFGLLGVLGSFFMQTKNFEWIYVLPAASCGLFATGVLNVNNIRDMASDEKAGKRSIPVRIGRLRAVRYHWCLLTLGWLASGLFVAQTYRSSYQILFLLALPLFIKNAWAVKTKIVTADLDPFLKQLALSTLLFVVLFGIGQLF